jgi:RNA polymerase sigma-70 factor (ECF subfamily)
MSDERRGRLFERGRARWPELPLAYESFLELAGPHLEELAGVEEERVCAEDLFLVAACLARLPGAVDRFDAFVWPQLERHLRRMEPQDALLEEMRQALLVRLFVPESADAPPRIARYSGRGPLIVWLRMAAARLALNLQRDERRRNGVPELEGMGRLESSDIELSFIRGLYEADFVAALREAMAELDGEQRLLLQLRYRDRLTSTQIGALVKLNRVTAHRRVVAARDALSVKVREKLRARLTLSQSGLEHLMGLLSSRLVPVLTAQLRDGLS